MATKKKPAQKAPKAVRTTSHANTQRVMTASRFRRQLAAASRMA